MVEKGNVLVIVPISVDENTKLGVLLFDTVGIDVTISTRCGVVSMVTVPFPLVTAVPVFPARSVYAIE